ncbi:MAG: hypothetical protein KKD77_23090 [Gammaproteobacteria bacterium]|nr:hypothetical protein [Gammaproteobacteria bacterium]
MGQKVSFDELTKIITVTQAPDANDTVTINVKRDLYSDGKEDWVTSESLRKFPFPITSIGGNPLPGNKYVGATFFLDSTWKIKPYSADHRMVIEGNLYATDGSNPFLSVYGYTVSISQEVSTLVVKVPTGAAALTEEEHNKLMQISTYYIR